MSEHTGPEKRTITLSDDDIEKIATRTKELVLEEIYIAVGRSVVSKVLWMLGAAAAAVAAWLHLRPAP